MQEFNFEAFQARAGYWYVDRRDDQGGETVAGLGQNITKDQSVTVASKLNEISTFRDSHLDDVLAVLAAST